MADVIQRYFCHQCSLEIPRVAADFTCPTCNSGFIEELGQDQAPPAPQAQEGPIDYDQMEQMDHMDHMDHMGQVLGPLEALLPGLLGGGRGVGPLMVGGHRGGVRPRIRIARGGNRPQNLGMDQAALENALQDFIVNLAGMDFGAGAAAGMAAQGPAQFHFVAPGAGGGGGGFHLHGNPGDYAWGRGGLDAIITQLLNHMDGTGPPPMAKENIAGIPTVQLSGEQREKNGSCSVCWEDFTEGEGVKQLECEHCFHAPCIVPWLELHGTCPVCRKELGSQGQGQAAAAGSPTSPTTGPTAPTEDEAVGGSPATGAGSPPPRRSSVTVSGAGSLTGLIQSALNQVFASPWTSQPAGGSSSTAPSPNSTTTSTTSPPTSTSTTSTQQSGVSSSSGGSVRSPPAQEEDGTPATRRPRLDTDFVDLDFD